MRHRQVVALAAVALVGLTACEGPDPNSLAPYYDAPAPTSAPVTTADVPVSPA